MPMSCFVDVILPLPLSGSFTYRLAPSYEAEVQVGSRVVVQFGGMHAHMHARTHTHTHTHTSLPMGDGSLYTSVHNFKSISLAAQICHQTLLALPYWQGHIVIKMALTMF